MTDLHESNVTKTLVSAQRPNRTALGTNVVFAGGKFDMKRILLLAAPFVLALSFTGAVRADDWTVTVGCQKCAYEKDSGATECGPACKTAEGKVLLLKGDAVKELKFKDGGE